MARMVATKTALSVRVDALADADDKSDVDAARMGLEARAKLESRLSALEAQGDMAGARRYAEPGGSSARKTQRVELHADAARTYNAAADVVDDLVPAQRDPLQAAVQAVLDVKDEKKRAKEEKRRKRSEKNGAATGDESAMDVSYLPFAFTSAR